jgi:hypothetical protein
MLPRSSYNCPVENHLDFGSQRGAIFLNTWCDHRCETTIPATSRAKQSLRAPLN